MTEQQGKSEGGKKPPSRSIRPENSNFSKLEFYRAACQKDLFDKLKERPDGPFLFCYLFFSAFISLQPKMIATIIKGIMPIIPVGAGPTKGLPPSKVK